MEFEIWNSSSKLIKTVALDSCDSCSVAQNQCMVGISFGHPLNNMITMPLQATLMAHKYKRTVKPE